VVVVGAVVAHAVDEKRGRAVDPAAYAAEKILVHPFAVGMLSQRALDLGCGNPQQGRVFGQMKILERILMRIERVMHLPEFALRGGRLGDLRRVLGMRMHLGQRKIAEDEPKSVAERLLDLLNNRVRHAAIRTLIVGVFHQGHGRMRGTADVIALAYREDELWWKI